MSKAVFEGIKAGLEDAIAFQAGDLTRGRVATVDVKQVREATAMTQESFARTFRLPVATVRDWEQGRRRPDSGSQTLLRMIGAAPKDVQAILERVAP